MTLILRTESSGSLTRASNLAERYISMDCSMPLRHLRRMDIINPRGSRAKTSLKKRIIGVALTARKRCDVSCSQDEDLPIELSCTTCQTPWSKLFRECRDDGFESVISMSERFRVENTVSVADVTPAYIRLGAAAPHQQLFSTCTGVVLATPAARSMCHLCEGEAMSGMSPECGVVLRIRRGRDGDSKL